MQTSAFAPTESKFLIKVSADAIRRNADQQRPGRPVSLKYPVRVIVNGKNQEQTRFVFGVRARVESRVIINVADGRDRALGYALATNEVDVQLNADGEFRSFSSLLEEGAIRWNSWDEEYDRTGLNGC